MRKAGRIELRDAEELEVRHHPQVCPKCRNFCVHNGTSYIHGDGVAMEKCLPSVSLDSVVVTRTQTAEAIAMALDGEAARFEDIGWSVAAKVWRQTADFVREWAAQAVH
jgi:hypothetical protein